ncbi:hypothetical protein N0V85_004846 [Neurospora sp. IMI 360204]|nr:hypothetical protein N0V85_004846 [Neurospora sp. IMI 360204]
MPSQEINNKTTAKRHEVSLWHEIKDHVHASTAPLKKADAPMANAAVPFARCYVCLDELDIKGIPPVGPAVETRAGCFIPCGHFFCVMCWKVWVRSLKEPVKCYVGPTNPLPVNGIQDNLKLTVMDLSECYRYGQSKPYREFACPICKTDLHHSGCCCEIRPVMIPTNKPKDRLVNLLALPKTFLEVPRDTRTTVNESDTAEDNEENTDNEQDVPDDEYNRGDDKQDKPDDKQGVPDEEHVTTNEEADVIIEGYRQKLTPAYNNHRVRRFPNYSDLIQQESGGSTVILPARPLVYDIQTIPQPGFYPVMRLRAQYPNIQDPNGWNCRVTGGRLDKVVDPNGWNCRVTGGRLDKVVDPVCGQCIHDLTRYRFLQHKYDEAEPYWPGYDAHRPTLPGHLDGGGLRQFSGLSWKHAVIFVYLRADNNDWTTKPNWGRWPIELDFMLQARGWAKGVEFVDWKKGCSELEGDWVPRPSFNGLRSRFELEGMGYYPDWDELFEQPYWRARGITKIPRNHWSDKSCPGSLGAGIWHCHPQDGQVQLYRKVYAKRSEAILRGVGR